MRRRKQKFFLVSFALHAFLLFAVYQIGCPSAVVHSEPVGLSVQVLTAHLSAPFSAPRSTTAAAREKIAPLGAQPQAGNSDVITQSAAAPVGVTNGAEVSAKERYLYEMRLLLDSRKHYPALARSLGQEGRVEVGFVLQADGRVVRTDMVAPSPHANLNRAALQLAGAIEKFQPLPAELRALANWHVTVPIDYHLVKSR